ncbi:MAG: CoA-binding protein [Pedosphaera sp.]|nr:CoA-binding protein [Pedosphaera sp.]
MGVVVVIGASSDRSSFSNKAVRAFLEKGHTVHPVNPREQTIETLKCHDSILHVPVRPDIVSVYVRPERLLKLLPDIARRGCGELWLNPGTVSDEVLHEAEMFGLKATELCSIVALGFSPDSL